MRDSYRRIRTAIARINSYTQEHITGMSLVQLFNRQSALTRISRRVNRTHLVAFKDSILAYALYYPVVEILSSVAIALVIWIGGRGVMRGAVSIGVLVAFIQYSQRFFRPIQDLSEKYNILQAAMAASERVFKLSIPSRRSFPPGTQSRPTTREASNSATSGLHISGWTRRRGRGSLAPAGRACRDDGH